MFAIPVQPLNDQYLEVSLSGASYYLRLMWNGTFEYWSAALTNSTQTVLVSGIAICPNRPLFVPAKVDGLPPGYFICIAPDRRDTISFDDLTTGAVMLYYAEPEDFLDLST